MVESYETRRIVRIEPWQHGRSVLFVATRSQKPRDREFEIADKRFAVPGPREEDIGGSVTMARWRLKRKRVLRAEDKQVGAAVKNLSANSRRQIQRT